MPDPSKPIDLRRWLGHQPARVQAGLGEDIGVDVVQQPATPLGPLVTLGGSTLKARPGDQVVALVTDGIVVGFRVMPTLAADPGLVRRVADLESRVANLESGGRGAPAKRAPAKRAAAKRAAAKKAPTKRQG